MPRVTKIFRVGATDIPVNIVKTLHSELAAVGLPVTEAEASGTPRFDIATESRVKEFQKRHRLPDTGNLDPVTGGVMSLTALVATEQDGGQLRAALRAAEGQLPNAPLYNYWLARYAIMTRDYVLARRVRSNLDDIAIDPDGLVFNIPDPDPSPQQPEVPFPENFYSYQHSLMAQEDIDTLRTQAPAGVMPRLARANTNLGDLQTPLPPPQPPPGIPDPPPVTGSGMSREEKLATSALAFLNAIEAWQVGNAHFSRQRYAGAIQSYNRCQQAILDYFSVYPDYNLTFTTDTLSARVDELVWHLASDKQQWSDIWAQVEWRRQLLSLAELGQFDWRPITGGRFAHIVYQLLQGNLAGSDQPPPPTNPIGPQHRKILMDTRLLIMGAVLVPLARGEANRLRRQYALARDEFSRVLRKRIPNPVLDSPLQLTAFLACEFIEVPFARLLLAETLFDQAESQYKSRVRVKDQADVKNEAEEAQRTADLAELTAIAQDFTARNIPGHAGNATQPLQHLIAAVSYAAIFDTLRSMDPDGAYVSRTKEALDILRANIASTIANAQPGSRAFRSMGQQLTLPTVVPLDGSLPKLIDSKHPHQPYLKIEGPTNQAVDERNPRVYAILLQAQARLLQIWSGFNYLGYPDDHVPTWRFMFLLERARYFTEHAKNAQREYLNFLSNAEREEFQELTASQNVELEKSNIRIETARVDQVRLEVESAKASGELARLQAQNAQDRFDTYVEFNEYANEIMDTRQAIPVGNLLNVFPESVSTFLENVPVVGGVFSSSNRKLLEAAQREFEKHNLELAVKEAQQAAKAADAQLAVAEAAETVAGLQRQAALLRHEFAIQNLSFLRNRTLNAELWYRLSGAIRSVADTYLRYGIEMAFLAEQAYEFEADKRMDVIRFDYDISDLGDMLAGDFLLRDLNTLEQDLIVGQKLRQQQVRYILSLAREYPEALQELRERGVMTFSLRLEQLERRFPGLFNLRISSVEVLPIALIDATRFSLELTQLGSGFVRLKTQPGETPTAPPTDATARDWLVGLESEWAIRSRLIGPETAVFTGLSRQDVSGNAAFFASNQRGAFEGLPGAGAWRIDMSMKENRVVPDSLVDVLITFTLSGYYDTNLRDAIDRAPRQPMGITTWFSARQSFPDAHYQFNRTGRMDWKVSHEFLALQGSLGDLQNVAVLCVPSQKRPELGRMMCSYPIELLVDVAGTITLLRELPKLSLTTNGLGLTAGLLPGTSFDAVTLDYGDGTGLTDALTHTYARPGRYEVLLRLAANGRLTEYRAVVVVSRQHSVQPPCIAIPDFLTTIVGDKVKLQPSLQVPSGEPLSVSWRIDGENSDVGSSPLTFTLDPGRYVLRLTVVRPLIARFYSQQRHVPTIPVAFDSLHVATNRTFDVATGNETTTNLNTFGQHVFGGPVLSPTDRWTLELLLDDNPSLVSVSPADNRQHDMGELSDVFLALEYKVKDE